MNRYTIISIAILLLVLSIGGCIDRQPAAQTDNVSTIWLQEHNVTNISARVEQEISRTDDMGDYLENELQRLRDEGEDVEDLQRKMELFNGIVENARQTKRSADMAHNNNSPKKAKQQYFESAKDMYRSHLVIKEVLQDPRISLPGQVTLENNNISIYNDGYVSLSGDLNIQMSSQNATIALIDPRNNASINLEATYTTAEKDQMKTTVYERFSGNMELSGSGLTVLITGDNVSIDASGRGKVLMKGSGTYIIRDVIYQIPDMISPPALRFAKSSRGNQGEAHGPQGP